MPDSDNLRQVHLAEINALRAYHGLGALTIHTGQGTCVSHWDRQGLSPYMRYSREGGSGYSQENISVNNCDGRGPGPPAPAAGSGPRLRPCGPGPDADQ